MCNDMELVLGVMYGVYGCLSNDMVTTGVAAEGLKSSWRPGIVTLTCCTIRSECRLKRAVQV